jgi:hypothetical protein
MPKGEENSQTIFVSKSRMLWKMACAFTQFMIKQIVNRVRKMLKEITLELLSYEKSNVVENCISIYTIYIKNIIKYNKKLEKCQKENS